MEAFLNFVWVCIAVAALGAWRWCWIREHRGRRRDPVHEWAAVVCALVLLFFAVSLSDDLRSSVVLMEESAGARRHSAMLSSGPSSAHATPQLRAHSIGLPQRSFVVSPRFHLVSATGSEESDALSTELGLTSGRDPPSSQL